MKATVELKRGRPCPGCGVKLKANNNGSARMRTPNGSLAYLCGMYQIVHPDPPCEWWTEYSTS